MSEYKEIFEALTAAVTFLAAFGALWWRISRGLLKTAVHIKTTGDQLEKLTLLTTDLTKNVIELSTKINEREKEIIKLEGSIDTQRKDMLHLITALQQANGSLNALWRTMQTLFPQAVPKRASDERR